MNKKDISKKDKFLVRLEMKLSEKIRKRADEETRSINGFIVNALKQYLSWRDI